MDIKHDSMLYQLAQDNVTLVNPVQWLEGYTDTKPLYTSNILRVENASGASLFKIHTKI